MDFRLIVTVVYAIVKVKTFRLASLTFLTIKPFLLAIVLVATVLFVPI